MKLTAACDAIGWAVASELMKGVSERELSPWGTATRSQTAMILARFLSFTAEGPQSASNGGSEAEATPLPTVSAAEREPELPLTE